MKSRKIWIIIPVATVLVLCTLCAIIVALLPGKGDEQARSGPTSQLEDAGFTGDASPRPTATVADIDYHVVTEELRRATNAQKDATFRELRGARVRWTGWIEEVTKEGKVYVDMDPPDAFSGPDVDFYVSEEDAVKFNKEQQVTFEATISDITELFNSFSFHLDEVTFLD